MNVFDQERKQRILEILDPRNSDGENAEAVLSFVKEEVRSAYMRGLEAGKKKAGQPQQAARRSK